jgi:hypothetical protein
MTKISLNSVLGLRITASCGMRRTLTKRAAIPSTARSKDVKFGARLRERPTMTS